MTSIRDSIHGYIKLDKEEKQLLDSPEVQRLRRISQLGLTSLVYPSATHTRFQHSLGVMHLAGKFAESLGLSDENMKKLRIAGLLHDSGHGPFSHASELVAENHGLNHEKLSCEVVEELDHLYSCGAEDVKDIILGKGELGKVLAGDIDADRMDYLVRDSHSSGLEHGNIDTATIVRLAEMENGKIFFDGKAVQALESLFISRFHMIRSLYRHHTTLIAEKMLQRSMESLLETGVEIEEMMEMDDYEAHNLLLEEEESREIYSRIRDRDLYKRALVWGEEEIGREGLETVEERIGDTGELEANIAEKAGVNPEKVIVDPPITPETGKIDVKVKQKDELRDLSEISSIVTSLQEAEWRQVALKVYCPEKHLDEVGEAARSILENYSSVLKGYT